MATFFSVLLSLRNAPTSQKTHPGSGGLAPDAANTRHRDLVPQRNVQRRLQCGLDCKMRKMRTEILPMKHKSAIRTGRRVSLQAKTQKRRARARAGIARRTWT